MTIPFALCIFVADCDTDGLRIVDKSNWIGKALVFPRALLPQVTAQTLLLGGSGNPAGVTAARELAAGIAGARVEVIGRAGGSVPTEAPQEFNQLLYDFLA